MRFYCPNCQKEYDVEPLNTITTLNKRKAFKAACPVCRQDMAEFVAPTEPGLIKVSDPVEDIAFTEAQKALNAAAEDLAQHPVATLPKAPATQGSGNSNSI